MYAVLLTETVTAESRCMNRAVPVCFNIVHQYGGKILEIDRSVVLYFCLTKDHSAKESVRTSVKIHLVILSRATEGH